ncbi:MAG TPA: hypothetical protein VMT88_11730 [Actinomycetes bacterium]|nr:hypothetical protein [Actinomycetes bacterium]
MSTIGVGADQRGGWAGRSFQTFGSPGYLWCVVATKNRTPNGFDVSDMAAALRAAPFVVKFVAPRPFAHGYIFDKR